MDDLCKIILSSASIPLFHVKALVFLYAFEESVDFLCFRLFAMIQTCTYLYSSIVLSTMGVSKESISKFLIGNLCVILRVIYVLIRHLCVIFQNLRNFT